MRESLGKSPRVEDAALTSLLAASHFQMKPQLTYLGGTDTIKIVVGALQLECLGRLGYL